MRIVLISVGSRMPLWARSAFEEFSKRLPAECRLRLHEIEAGKRGKNPDIKRLLDQEAERMLAAVPDDALCIALEVNGRQWSSEELAGELAQWAQAGRDVALLVGGADGLAAKARQRADTIWSLSRLTLPHMLVRVVVAEQLYRAWSIGRGLPYHRA